METSRSDPPRLSEMTHQCGRCSADVALRHLSDSARPVWVDTTGSMLCSDFAPHAVDVMHR